jgi:hypothetical protein
MQTGTTQLIAYRGASLIGLTAVVSCFSAMRSWPVISDLAILIPRFRKLSARSRQIQGWAMKAFEFNDSGPPVLLNNPCCCRRVVSCSFLKHAMEVHYG